jgi:hypothetical protein
LLKKNPELNAARSDSTITVAACAREPPAGPQSQTHSPMKNRNALAAAAKVLDRRDQVFPRR